MDKNILYKGNDKDVLFVDLCQIIDTTKQRISTTVNSGLTLMYWGIGNRINSEVLGHERAEYGKQIVSAVSSQLRDKYGRKGYELRNIQRMM